MIDMKYIDFHGKSSMVLDAAYDISKKRLFLGYDSGNYYYDNVAPHVFRGIVNAYKEGNSIGSEIHRSVNLSDGIYAGSGDLELLVGTFGK